MFDTPRHRFLSAKAGVCNYARHPDVLSIRKNMEVLHGLYDYRWIILLLTLGGWAVVAALKQATRTEIHLLHQRNDPLFRSVLEQHGIREVEILRDSTIPGVTGSHGRPFTVHLILRSPPDRWWVYIHVQDSDPVLRPISEARARAALG